MTLLLEYWKPVVGYEGLYEVSNTGRIHSLIAGIEIKQRHGGTGYRTVSLSKNSSRTHCQVHEIVAEAFVEGEPDLTEAIHSDGWRMNNRASNLIRLSVDEAADQRQTARREYARLYYHSNRERIMALAAPRVEQRKATQRRYYQDNKEQLVEKIEAYRKQNKDKINARTQRKRAESSDFTAKERGWHTKRYSTNPRYRLRVLATNAKYRSKAIGVEAHADCLDAIYTSPPLRCACCGNELDFERSRTPRSPSIDRIHNDFGYVTGNVVVICVRCNTLKRNGTIAEFEQILAYMKSSHPLGEQAFAAPAHSSDPPKAFWKVDSTE